MEVKNDPRKNGAKLLFSCESAKRNELKFHYRRICIIIQLTVLEVNWKRGHIGAK